MAIAFNGCAIYSTVEVHIREISKKKYLTKEQIVWTIEDTSHIVRVIQNRHNKTAASLKPGCFEIP